MEWTAANVTRLKRPRAGQERQPKMIRYRVGVESSLSPRGAIG